MSLCGCADLSVAPFDVSAWTRQAPEDDPLPDHRPDDLFCVGFVEEAGLLEVDTAVCTYLSVEQPARRALRVGERLVGGLATDPRWADPPTDAHAALLLDGHLLWEVYLPVPGPAAFEALDVTLDRRVPEGAPLVFHLHNHGVNSYRLLPVEAAPR